MNGNYLKKRRNKYKILNVVGLLLILGSFLFIKTAPILLLFISIIIGLILMIPDYWIFYKEIKSKREDMDLYWFIKLLILPLVIIILVIGLVLYITRGNIQESDGKDKMIENIQTVEEITDYYHPNYANGNGTIIKVEKIGDMTKVYRKHIDQIQIKDILNLSFFENSNHNIYLDPEFNEKIIGVLNFGDLINIEQILEMNDENNYFVWLNIKKRDNVHGWFFLGESGKQSVGFNLPAEISVPYYNNRWEILESININNRIWTIRNMNNQTVAIYGTTNIYNNPGLIDSNIISQIILKNDNDELIVYFIEIISATEEKEKVDGETDRWLKINHNGIEGWIFGGYAGVERGGLKYYIPDDMIDLCLTFLTVESYDQGRR